MDEDHPKQEWPPGNGKCGTSNEKSRIQLFIQPILICLKLGLDSDMILSTFLWKSMAETCVAATKNMYIIMHEASPLPLHQQRVQCGHTWLNLCGIPGQQSIPTPMARENHSCPACKSSALTKGVGILRFPDQCGLSTIVHPWKIKWNLKMEVWKVSDFPFQLGDYQVPD